MESCFLWEFNYPLHLTNLNEVVSVWELILINLQVVLAVDYSVQDNTQRPHICCGIVVISVVYLWRVVELRAEGFRFHQEFRGGDINELRTPEVTDLVETLIVDQDVLWFQITVEKMVFVHLDECHSYLSSQCDDVLKCPLLLPLGD